MKYLLPLLILLTMVGEARADDAGPLPDVIAYDMGHEDAATLDAAVAAAPSAAPSAPAPPSLDGVQLESQAKAAQAAAGELGAAIRTRNLPGVLVALSLLLFALAKGLAALGLAKTQRAEAVLMIVGGVAAAGAYLGWADDSALRETKATLLGMTGGGALGLAVAAERLGLGDVLARLLGRRGGA